MEHHSCGQQWSVVVKLTAHCARWSEIIEITRILFSKLDAKVW